MVIENGNFVDKMVIFVDELNIHKLSPKWYFCKKRGIPLVLVLFDTHEIWKWYFLENGTFWLFVFQTPTLTKMVTENGFSTKWYFCFPKRGWWWGNGLPFSRARTVHYKASSRYSGLSFVKSMWILQNFVKIRWILQNFVKFKLFTQTTPGERLEVSNTS